MPRPIRTLLIANRGEIACRVIRTARRLGVHTIAVHSDADAAAPHVRAADLALGLPGNSAAETYLNGAAIVAAAVKAGADAVHPGYGFLSENSGFAETCAAAGLVFVGPPAAAIHAMGDKARAKALMERAGVPVVPGYAGDDQSPAHLAAEARRLGYPLLIKAAAGGGGRGMRAVARPDDFVAALESARREAENAFGDPAVLIERLVEDGRHIEIQVFADGHGNVVHLGERDCSAQRRHQKVIEEAPSPFVDAVMRAAMGADAVKAARAVGYRGAGTVEFIVGADRRYYFLEMNTRLQVEHPVTEMITGLDLVEWQLRVAAGEALPLAQEEIALCGHAIEARIYAEDPAAGFRPQTGRILRWRPQAVEGRDGLRVDDGIAEGLAVPPFYDPMLAKVIARGRNRAEAIARLDAALADLPVIGVRTNRTFLRGVLDSDVFREGRMTTPLLDRWAAGEGPFPLARPATPLDFATAAGTLALAPGGDWFRSTGIAECPVVLTADGETRHCTVRFVRGRLANVEVEGETVPFDTFSASMPEIAWSGPAGVGRALAVVDGRDLWLDRDGRTRVFTEPDDLAAREPAADPSRVVSPVSGLVRVVEVEVGSQVEAGQTLVVIEAMKMETTLQAMIAGTVRSLRVARGQQARAGDLLVEIEAR